MPPRPSPPPAGNSRRRPAPAMPGGWVWVVILGMVVAIVFLNQEFSGGSTITLSDLFRLAETKNVSKLSIIGEDQVNGEVKDAAKVPEDMRLRGTKFTVTWKQNAETSKVIQDWVKHDKEL